MRKSDSIKKQPYETSARDADATSKDTLADLEDDTDLSGDENSSSDNSPGPSPDGTLDEADALDDAGPM